jgi:hypothetical protein
VRLAARHRTAPHRPPGGPLPAGDGRAAPIRNPPQAAGGDGRVDKAEFAALVRELLSLMAEEKGGEPAPSRQ